MIVTTRLTHLCWQAGRARPRGRSVRYLAAIAGSAAVLLGMPGQAGAAARQAATVTLTVTNLQDSSFGSLRWAIESADTSAPGTAAVIDFDVAGVITLATALPAITADTSLDALTAPGYVPGGPPVVEIDCNWRAGLVFRAGAAGSQLLGLAVGDAGRAGIILGASRVTINDDYIGLDLAGHALGNRGAGVYVSARSYGDLIGGNPSGDPGVVANVISANRGSGIVLAGSSHDTIAANRIGTNPAGSARMGNGGDGIELTRGADGNEIGGTDYTDPTTGEANNPTGDKGTVPPVFVVPPLGNLISGNGSNGVLITGGSLGNKLNGNFVGTTASGNAALGNRDNGVWIDHSGRNSLTGCTFVENPFVYYNVLSGNGLNGLRITSSYSVKVQGNFFGIAANNATRLANRLNGILVEGTSANTQVGGVIPLGNVSAGNGQNGIEVTGRVRGFVTFNTFGGLAAFGGAVPNGNDGVLITATGGDNLARTNVLSGNRRNGIELAGNARGVTVDPDIVGLNTKGNAPLPNGGDGLLIDGSAHDNTIGGSRRSVIPQNTFSGNDGHGIVITGRAYDNRVFSSYIGPLILGVKPGGNHRGGVLIAGRASGNTIGGTRPPANLISANIGTGVTLTAGTSRNRVIGNYIGLDRLGRCLPNTGRPVVNKGRHNKVKGNRTRPRRSRRGCR
jgi:parallel beta-helix repeat protein